MDSRGGRPLGDGGEAGSQTRFGAALALSHVARKSVKSCPGVSFQKAPRARAE